MQQENNKSYNTILYISSKSLYIENFIWLEKNEWFWDSKNCHKISYHIFDLENIAGHCTKKDFKKLKYELRFISPPN